MSDWIKYRITEVKQNIKNKDIQIETFNKPKHNALIPQIYADAFCDKAWGEAWSEIKEFKPESCFIAKYNGEYAGFIISFIRQNTAYISVIAVLHKYQKKGIGRTLINKVVNHFKKQKLEIYLDVEIKNTKAINWYNNLGFIPIGE